MDGRNHACGPIPFAGRCLSDATDHIHRTTRTSDVFTPGPAPHGNLTPTVAVRLGGATAGSPGARTAVPTAEFGHEQHPFPRSHGARRTSEFSGNRCRSMTTASSGRDIPRPGIVQRGTAILLFTDERRTDTKIHFGADFVADVPFWCPKGITGFKDDSSGAIFNHRSRQKMFLSNGEMHKASDWHNPELWPRQRRGHRPTRQAEADAPRRPASPLAFRFPAPECDGTIRPRTGTPRGAGAVTLSGKPESFVSSQHRMTESMAALRWCFIRLLAWSQPNYCQYPLTEAQIRRMA